MDGGHGVSRKAVMHNDFIVVGPADDPAHDRRRAPRRRRSPTSPRPRHLRLARRRVRHEHQGAVELWEAAGIEPKGSWYIETGQGMGETLTIASQKQAYTLSDRGTFLATNNLDCELLVEGGEDLLNPYHVIVVKGEGVNRACAQEFSTGSPPRRPRRRSGASESPSTASRSSSRRQGLMDPVPEVLGRSALVSLSATAIALALACPARHLAGARRAPGPRRARDRGEHRDGGSHRGGRPARGAAAVAQRSAREPRPDLHAARDDHRPGPDRRAADRRDHDGGAAGAAARARDQLRALGANTPAARHPALDRGARAAPGRRHGRLRARDLGGRRRDHRRRQHPRPDAGDDHVDRRERRARATSTRRSSTRRSCSGSRSRSTRCSRQCSSAPPHGRSPEACETSATAVASREVLGDRRARAASRRAAGGARSERRRQDDAAAAAGRARDAPAPDSVEIDGASDRRRRAGAAAPDRLRDTAAGAALHERASGTSSCRCAGEGSTRRRAERRALAALERLGVAHLADRKARVALGRRSAAGQPRAGPRDRARRCCCSTSRPPASTPRRAERSSTTSSSR